MRRRALKAVQLLAEVLVSGSVLATIQACLSRDFHDERIGPCRRQGGDACGSVLTSDGRERRNGSRRASRSPEVPGPRRSTRPEPREARSMARATVGAPRAAGTAASAASNSSAWAFDRGRASIRRPSRTGRRFAGSSRDGCQSGRLPTSGGAGRLASCRRRGTSSWPPRRASRHPWPSAGGAGLPCTRASSRSRPATGQRGARAARGSMRKRGSPRRWSLQGVPNAGFSSGPIRTAAQIGMPSLRSEATEARRPERLDDRARSTTRSRGTPRPRARRRPGSSGFMGSAAEKLWFKMTTAGTAGECRRSIPSELPARLNRWRPPCVLTYTSPNSLIGDPLTMPGRRGRPSGRDQRRRRFPGAVWRRPAAMANRAEIVVFLVVAVE